MNIVMCKVAFMIVITLTLGCTSEPRVVMESTPPPNADTSFHRLSQVIAGIKPSDVSLYEGLPSIFWEPQARAQELQEKSTIDVRGHRLYEEPLKLEQADAGSLTALFANAGSFQKYRPDKACSGFNADYCLEWKSGAGTTHALISLECGEVEIFTPQAELHCDFSDAAARRIRDLLHGYSNNRPDEESTP